MIGALTAPAGCGSDEKPSEDGVGLANTVLALSPAEYNNTVADLLGLPADGSAWPDEPDIAERLNASQGEQAGLFGTAGTELPPGRGRSRLSRAFMGSTVWWTARSRLPTE